MSSVTMQHQQRQVYEALLQRFCEDTGLDFQAVSEMLEGRRLIHDVMVHAFDKVLGIPPTTWRNVIPELRALAPPVTVRRKKGKAASRTSASPLVTFAGAGQATGVTPEGRRGLQEGGRRRRRYPTRVHAVLDELGWTVYELAEKLTKALGRPVSRASAQFWATGSRQVGPKGKSVPQPVQAPLEVRIAAEKLTGGRLKRSDWPNVEPDPDGTSSRHT